MLNRAGKTENNYLYSGEQYDANIRFYYLRSRYYNKELGRFINKDPFNGSIYDPPSIHKYLYAEGDPVNNIDPSGLFSFAGTMTVIAISAVIVSIAFPNIRGQLAKFSGNTNNFSLQFVIGGTLGQILFGGAVMAYIIEEKPSKGYYPHRYRGLFTVMMLRLGSGAKVNAAANAVIASTPTLFSTATKRRIQDFQGIGRMTAIEFGLGAIGIGIGSIHLPDGTYLKTSFGCGAGITWGYAGYVVMTFWWLRNLEKLW